MIVNGDLSNYMKKLQNSGYNRQYRKEILLAGKKAWAEMKRVDSTGEKPIYRTRGWKEEERRERKSE